MTTQKIDDQILSAIIVRTASDVIKKMSSEKFTADPVITIEPIDVIEDAMIISESKKFGALCYISVIYFYAFARDNDQHNPVGFIVLYLKDSGVMKLLEALNYSDSHCADEHTIKDMCGEFCNQIAGAFKKELVSIGYDDMDISVPESYRNSVPKGIVCNKKLKKLYSVAINLWGCNVVVVDMALIN